MVVLVFCNEDFLSSIHFVIFFSYLLKKNYSFIKKKNCLRLEEIKIAAVLE